ncbi:hypothetical protein FOC4_g10006227 [Fusarium odoratissimum]|uniref:Uncharacterized protein n=1 Tax=Fusarium oxysporum f. sp. cubense (strain race 4) TaxID=2502994 RepID=N1RAW5_FUSC4|nr:hypothetical protein FOC4_g10006227 [Fusarium odoratissimum]
MDQHGCLRSSMSSVLVTMTGDDRIASSLQSDIFCAALIGEEDVEGPFHRAPEEMPR